MPFFTVLALGVAQEISVSSNDMTSVERASIIYTERCSICHGEQGAGNGPTAMAMKPKPTDFTQAEYWSNRTDAYVIQQIKYGAPEVFMPAFPKIPEKQLEALLGLLKSFQSNMDVQPVEE